MLSARICVFTFISFFFLGFAYAQVSPVPATHSGIEATQTGYVLTYQDEPYPESFYAPTLTLEAAKGNPKGTKSGISFDFQASELRGRLYYGFIPYGDSHYPHPVYFKRYAEIKNGKASIDIKKQLSGRYDMIDWEQNKVGTLGFRLMDASGLILYDGRVSFAGSGPFEVIPTLIEGPLVHQVEPDKATISFTLSSKAKANIILNDGPSIPLVKRRAYHEVALEQLEPNTTYEYTVQVGPLQQTYSFKTAPEKGSRQPFTFAYASDSRAGQGGGERDIYGANAYIMKRIMALATQEEAAFMQFSGDLINGYLTSPEEIDLQYANWKRAVEPFWHYLPIYISMGNHEALTRLFQAEGKRFGASVDRWPYDTESAEAVFARNFVNPHNGPESEDGASYDPRPKKTDFPPYDENVFFYTYDNVGVVVLNSDYWYAPSTGAVKITSGNIHAYIMDQQLDWLAQTLDSLERNPEIDHIFVTQHTPCFPNGGHVGDDMWYRGNNDWRPYVAGKPVAKGIIERRDQILDLLVNKSSKVIAILTGDEHNYARTTISPDMERYPEGYPGSQKITLSRTIYQINNGAAGAPYYAQEETPWSDHVSGFTTQNALVFFDVEGKSIKVRVLNPDTLEEVDSYELR